MLWTRIIHLHAFIHFMIDKAMLVLNFAAEGCEILSKNLSQKHTTEMLGKLEG